MVTRTLSWLANLGLQLRIQLLAVVSLLAIFTFFWIAGHWAVEESNRQGLENQLAVANLVASSLDQQLNSTLNLLETTAAQLELEEVSGHPDTASVTLLRDAQLQLSNYGRSLFWLDTQGRVLWTEPFDASLLSKPFPHFPLARPALENGDRHILTLGQPSNTSQACVLLIVPVSRPTGETDSLLVEEINVDQLGLQGVLGGARPAGSTHIQVVDREGEVLLSSSSELGSQPPRADRFAALIDNHQPTMCECHACHPGSTQGQVRRTQEVLAFAPLSVAPWGVAVRRPTSEVMASIGHLRRFLLIGGGAALVATWLITRLVTRQIVEPIQALDEASAQFAAGNLDVAIPSGGIDEVAHLTANLEQMRVRLEATLKDHRRWNEALEEMVQERTRELAVLYEQLQGRETMCKRLLGKVLTAQEEERARLARELHDSIGQSLTAIIMTTTAVEGSLPADLVSAKEKLSGVRNIATQTLQDLRGLIFDLRPEVLDDLGLPLALHSQVKKYLEPAGVQVRLRAAGLKDQLPAEIETAVFRVVQEAITNIARHAQASEASISLTRKEDRLIVRVEDNGVGFDPNQVMDGERQAWGLRGMEERITLLGGRFYIGSRPGSGTLLLAEVPLDQNQESVRKDQ